MTLQRIWHDTVRARWLIGVIVVLTIIWELTVQAFQPPVFLLPAPSLIAEELLISPVVFVKHTLFTLLITLISFMLAVLFGLLLAIGIVYSTFVERTLYTLLIATNSVPKVALAPLFVIWLGTQAEPKIAISFTIAIFPIVIDSVVGLRSVHPDMIALANSCRASPMQLLFKMRLPNALPNIFSGMKVAISFALVGTIVGEFVAGEVGLGHLILLSQGNFNTARVFAAIVILGLIGTIMFYIVELIERLVVPWHVSQRTQEGY